MPATPSHERSTQNTANKESIAKDETNLFHASPLTVSVMIFANVLFTVGLVLINKAVFVRYHFPYSTTLLLFHLLSNTIYTAFYKLVCETEERNPQFHWKSTLPLSFLFVASIVFMNLSLMTNSVGFYQISKVLMTPALALIESVYMKNEMSSSLKLSLIGICLGATLVTVSDVHTSFVGLIISFIAVAITVVYQVYVTIRVKQLKVSTNEVMNCMAPQASVMLLFFIPFTDKIMPHQILYMVLVEGIPTETMIFVAITCLFSVGANLTSFNLVVYTSPLTFQVINHLKTTIIIAGGTIFFENEIGLRNICGIAIVLAAAFAYTYIKHLKQLELTKGQAQPEITKRNESQDSAA
eukprot:TRINITY_DN12379_c0_g1_i1.p1 TRINITY_DN12379_c0_g1~~TRINITY_DN12379_c0_g1_i1.p1  ORF type:complete len:354 (-),score=63.49 TRINITY_DN12379_c0_g1_i1:355-1416(-)